MSDHKPATVGEAYLSALHACGIRHVFANGGTDFAPIIEGLVQMKQKGVPAPNFITVPHENVAMAMAQGYSKISGEPSCVMVHVNVGTANTICALMNAARDNVPVLLAAGRTPLTETGHAGSRDVPIHWAQENFDQGAIARENVKWDYELRAGQPVNTVVARAIDIAMSEPKGPVYLTLPRETLGDTVVDAGPLPRTATRGAAPAAPALEALEQAADLIARAQMPLIIAGRPSTSPGAFEALAALADDFAIPVTSGPHPNLPSDHGMNLGFLTKPLLEAADVIIVLESPVPWVPRAMQPSSSAKIVHIAHDPLYRTYPLRGFPMDLAIAGDPAAALTMLREMLATKVREKASVIDARRGKVGELRAKIVEGRRALMEKMRNTAPISPIFVADALNQVKSKDAIIVEELGAPFPFLDLPRPDSFVSGTSGALGMALGQALGVKLAAPHRQVITTVGDGSYMFGVPLAAHFVARSEKLPTLTLVMNNSQWFAVRRATMAMYPEGEAAKQNSLPVVDLAPSPDFEKVAESCGGYGERVEDPAKLIPALERALRKVEDGQQVTLNLVTGLRQYG
jgi:acetolactate synthase-1/2/3 large subunit